MKEIELDGFGYKYKTHESHEDGVVGLVVTSVWCVTGKPLFNVPGKQSEKSVKQFIAVYRQGGRNAIKQEHARIKLVLGLTP